MINIGICDANRDIREELSNFINTYFSSHSYSYSILEFDSTEILSAYFEKVENEINLLITELDISNMFIALRKIRQNHDNLSIVINCNRAAYALKSFELWPLYYNIKPMSYNTLSKILDRFLLQHSNIKEENVLIKNGKKFMKLSFNEISFIESQNTTIRIHMNNYEILKTYGKLDDIEKQISNNRFLRCHKSFLINMDYVKSVDSFKFTTIFGDTVAIKQREASQIKKKYYEYMQNKEKYEK